MIAFPNCKINLGLHVLRKREDGYHDLETCFLPVKLQDAAEIVPSQDVTHFTATGTFSGNDADNLCLKAYHLLKADFPQITAISMHLHKVIPAGAGLGGGSADAACTLQLLNKIFELKISLEQLSVYALQLGSDCPFFLINKTSVATGRGEILKEINVPLKDYRIALVNPGIHISTGIAFKNIRPAIPGKAIRQIINQPIETWRDELKNDFEKFVFERYPLVKKIKEDLYHDGALYASMSGSGSTVYGIFEKNKDINYKPQSNFYYKIVQPIL
ncbi:MAG TPA: 4-(cytidine 5'-diphospho)-2-C-methyl-D-erythritol kinase [Chitinophagaceae bacterium]|nr:4-(cytidine 5'-diphospho)-2-C-methyl-D-erythritol kinase [Chitinophagaceae bacterium]